MTEQLNNTLASNFMLVSFAAGSISSTKPDKEWSEKVSVDAHVTQSGLARVYKSIFAGEIAKHYKAWTSAKGAVYTAYLAGTMPFNDSERHNRGDRIVPVTTAMEFATKIDGLIAEAQTKIEALAIAIDDTWNRAQAVAALGDMGDDSLIPTGQDVRDACYVEFNLSTLPDTAAAQGMMLPAEWVNSQLVAGMEARSSAAVNKAVGDATKRIASELDRIAKVTADLQSYHAGEWEGKRAPKVYDSLKTNIAGLAGMLRGTGEGLGRSDLTELADQITRSLTEYNPEHLRSSPELADKLNAEATRLQRALSPAVAVPATVPTTDPVVDAVPTKEVSRETPDNSDLVAGLDLGEWDSF